MRLNIYTLKCMEVLNGWQSFVNCRQGWPILIETVCGNYTKKRVLAYEREEYFGERRDIKTVYLPV